MTKHRSLAGIVPVIPGIVTVEIGKPTVRPGKAPVEPFRGPVFAGWSRLYDGDRRWGNGSSTVFLPWMEPPGLLRIITVEIGWSSGVSPDILALRRYSTVLVIFGFLKHFKTIGTVCWFDAVHHTWSRIFTESPRLYAGSAGYIPDHWTGINLETKPEMWEWGLTTTR